MTSWEIWETIVANESGPKAGSGQLRRRFLIAGIVLARPDAGQLARAFRSRAVIAVATTTRLPR
jgi:hypothetical protein